MTFVEDGNVLVVNSTESEILLVKLPGSRAVAVVSSNTLGKYDVCDVVLILLSSISSFVVGVGDGMLSSLGFISSTLTDEESTKSLAECT